jgi:hypothetical protein
MVEAICSCLCFYDNKEKINGILNWKSFFAFYIALKKYSFSGDRLLITAMKLLLFQQNGKLEF